jgi:hypothetical protein
MKKVKPLTQNTQLLICNPFIKFKKTAVEIVSSWQFTPVYPKTSGSSFTTAFLGGGKANNLRNLAYFKFKNTYFATMTPPI